MENVMGERDKRNAEIIKLRSKGYTLDEIGKRYDISGVTVSKICHSVIGKESDINTIDREERDNAIYECICNGYSIKHVSELYNLSGSNVHLVYNKMVEKQSELYKYLIKVLTDKKDVRYVIKILNKIGISTLKDFNDRSLCSMLDSTRNLEPPKYELIIKVKSQESFKLYEFLKQNAKLNYFKYSLYFILIKEGVETLDDFCNFKLNRLYYQKGIGVRVVSSLEELQQKAKSLNMIL